MSDFTKDIFARMDLQQIRAFLTYGTEEYSPTSEPYHIRIKTGSDPIYKQVKNLHLSEEQREEASSNLARALSSYQDVYMEIGMIAGARIIYQLLVAER